MVSTTPTLTDVIPPSPAAILKKSSDRKIATPRKSVRFNIQSPILSDNDSQAAMLALRRGHGDVKEVDLKDVSDTVYHAIRQMIDGNSIPYQRLLEHISKRSPVKDALPPSTLALYLRAFSQNISSLTPVFHSLVTAVLNMDWITWDDETVMVYKGFLDNLVSAHAVYVSSVGKMLVGWLRTGGDPARTTPAQHFARVHLMLRSILSLIPTGPSFMLPIITENFPHKREPLNVHVYYLHNILRIINYAQVLRDQVLAVIVDRLVQIDIDIQYELDELDDEVWEQVQQTLFQTSASNPNNIFNNHTALDGLEDNDDSDTDSEFSFTSDSDNGISPIVTPLHSTIEKLDTLLRLVFQYIAEISQKQPDDLASVFFGMMRTFERTVLPTHRVRCVQFLWFYTCSLHPSFPELFLGFLVSKLTDTSQPTILRISASAYLGSFISRARYVNYDWVKKCLAILCNWCTAFVDEFGAGAKTVDVNRFGVFYSVVQAVVYVFCWRWRGLGFGGHAFDPTSNINTSSNSNVLSPNALSHSPGFSRRMSRSPNAGADSMILSPPDAYSQFRTPQRKLNRLPPEMVGFDTVILSRFCPLRVCSRPIAMEFADLMRRLEVLYVHPLISAGPGANNIVDTNPNSAGHSRTNSGSHGAPPSRQEQGSDLEPQENDLQDRLDAFFPFDPLMLPGCRGYIDPLYQTWEGTSVSSDIDSSQSENDEESESDDDDDNDDGRFNKSFAGEGVSMSSNFLDTTWQSGDFLAVSSPVVVRAGGKGQHQSNNGEDVDGVWKGLQGWTGVGASSFLPSSLPSSLPSTVVMTLEKPQIISHVQKSLTYTPYDVKWIPSTARFVVLGQTPRGTGTIQIYELEKGDVSMVKQVEKPHAIKCGTFSASALNTNHLATGDFNGGLSMWDMTNPGSPVYNVQAHDQIINCIDGCGGPGSRKGPPELATGSRDGQSLLCTFAQMRERPLTIALWGSVGTVKVWDIRQKDRPVAKIAPAEGETAHDTWAVAFGNAYNDQERVLCAGYENGDVKLFDLRAMSLLWETNVRNGVCAVEFDRKDIQMNKLVVTSLESAFNVFDMRTKHEKHGYASLKEKAHGTTTIWSVAHLPQNRDIFMTSGGDGSLNLYKYNYPDQRSVKDANDKPMGVVGSVELLNTARMAEQPIAALDWSADKLGLCAFAAFDQAVRVGIVTRLQQY
ncbi:hypothetical protein HDU85_002974 [Gaertneriomyces sp. JEL0708]|nr:hypothetical protein HDU85_002974 [Gaertneriomyces sp. JEL0708]